MFSLISQLSHVEIVTPRLEQSRQFFTEVMGLLETARTQSSIYLRAWRNFFHHDLVLTEGEMPALGHIGWRSAGEAAWKQQSLGWSGPVLGLDGMLGSPGVRAVTAVAAQAAMCTRSSGRLSGGRHPLTLLRAIPTGRSGISRGALPSTTSTTSPSQRPTSWAMWHSFVTTRTTGSRNGLC